MMKKGKIFMINMNSNRILSDDEIVNIVIKYLDETLYNCAVMIDGDWGCGKTYFVKEYLIDKIDQNEKEKNEKDKKYNIKRVVYISLYGVKSIDDVSKQILMESYLAKTGKAKKFFKKGTKIVGTLLPVAFDIVKSSTGIKPNLNKVFRVINKFLKIKESIFIFDDLERCDCPVNEILGYINGFVEHEGFKIILVANQKEVRKRTYVNNLELKYLVAANKNIDFESKSENQNKSDGYVSRNQQDAQNEQPVSLNTIENRMNRVFGQDITYERVKEKLVGITINYQPDLQKVFSKLIKNDNLDDELQCYLKENINFFEKCMIKEDHLNLRTFQFFLSKINDLYKEISKIESEGKKAFLRYIIQYCFKVCIAYKKGSLEYTWEKNVEYSFKSMGRLDIFGSQLAFRFVDDFIIKSILDSKRVKDMFGIFEAEYIKRRDAFRKLDAEWYILEDDEVEQKIQQIFEDLENNMYDFKEYPRIIGLFIELEQVGFSKENTYIVKEKMKDNVFKSGQHIKIDNGYGLLQEDDKKKIYKELIEQLQNDIDQHFEKDISNTIEDYLNLEEEWGEKLEKYVCNNKTEIYQSIGFLRQINISKLCEKIKKSKPKDINAFRSCIIMLYVRGIIGYGVEQDREFLQELNDGIQAMDTKDFGKIKKVQISYLRENLKSAEEVFNMGKEDIL